MKNNKRKTPTALFKKLIRKRKAEVGTPTGYFPRHLARSVAKANMERTGVQHVNRHFALNWRKFVAR